MSRGVHGVWQPPAKDSAGAPRPWNIATWSGPMLATMADYATIRAGDLIFFFANRLIYGIGRALDPYANTALASGRGAFQNYPDSTRPSPATPTPNLAVLGPGEDAEWMRVRVVVPFTAAPLFFSEGIDMDEVLSSAGAEVAWGLRFWEGFSFRALGEAETDLLVQVFLRRFANVPTAPAGVAGQTVAQIAGRFDPTLHLPLSIGDMVFADSALYLNGDVFRNEEALHGLLVEALDPLPGRAGSLASGDRLDVFHEVPASPPKPPQWADAIDVMGTSRYPGMPSRAVHYVLIEAKKDSVTGSANYHDQRMSQLMKYVDFLARNYCGGNYAAITAYLVAHEYSTGIMTRHSQVRAKTNLLKRSYVLNPRETPPSREWDGLALLAYDWDGANKTLKLVKL
jgi:hypothetical protein